MKNKKTIYIEDIFKKAENRLKNIVYSKNFKKWFFYSFFIALIIIIVIFYNAFKSSEEAEATWWDDTWSYRRAITVTNNTTEESEVYINLSIDSSDTTKFQADCGDLRFTDINGNIIPYYIVSGCGTVSTSINVYYDTLKAGASTLYYYYGNSSADDGFSSTNFSTEALNYLVGTPSSEEKSKGPVGYWSFDEGYGTTANDGSGKGNDGTITGATWASEDQCVVGKCLSFDGVDDYIDINKNMTLSQHSESFWIKIIDYVDSNPGIFDLPGGNTSNSIYIGGTSNKLCEVADTWYCMNPDVVLSNNEWQFISRVYDGVNFYYYINGNLVDTKTKSTGNISKINRIGMQTIGNSNFNGFIDEPKIYPYARTADEIKQDYNAGLAGMGTSKGAGTAIGGSSDKWMTDGLVGHWKMDESSWDGTAGEVIDSSGNGNNGTAFGTVGGTASTTAGKFGSGGSFDGVDDYVNLGNSTSLDIKTGGYSVSSWVKRDETGSLHMILNDAVGGSTQKGFLLGIGSNDKLYSYVSDGSGTYVVENQISSSVIGTDWTFITWTFDRDGYSTFYINGEQNGSPISVNNAIDITNNSDVRLGIYVNNNYNFKGQIDQLRIYNRALSSDEVKKLYEYAPGPVGHWKMDEKSGTTAYDISGNGNHGTLTNSPTWTEGKYGGAVEFDGVDDNVNCGNDNSLNITNSFTLEAWIKRIGAGSDSWGDMIVAKSYTHNARSYDLRLDSEQKVVITFYNPDNTLRSLIGITELDDNKWYHITGTYDHQTGILSVYVDGNLDNSENIGQYSVMQTVIPVTLGAYLNSHDGSITRVHFNGEIDDVRIYNYARTQKQILEDMNAGRPAQNKPVAYWKFDEGYGTTAYDSAGNNNGTITGASWTNDGKFGKALSFDGDTQVVTTPTFDYESNLQYTLSAWIKSTGGQQTWLIKETNWNNGFKQWGDVSSWYFRVGDGINATSLWSVYTGLGVNSGEWFHWVMSRNNNTWTMYINGEYNSSRTDSTIGESNNGGILKIGNRQVAEWNPEFQGQMDEVKVYNYALSEDEIKKDYNQGKSLVLGAPSSDGAAGGYSSALEYCVPGSSDYCAGPVAEWKFDDKSGTTVYDTSSNANHGTMSNMEDSDWKTSDQCKKGRCLEFDGSDDYAIKSSPKNLPTGDGSWSFDFWVFPRSGMQGIGRKGWIIWRGGSSNDLLSIGAEDNKWEIAHWSNDWTSNATIEFNNWQYVSVVYDSSIGAGLPDEFIYINGKLKDSREAGPLNLSDSDLYLGVRGDNLSEKADMVLDNVKIYNYARTPAQVAWDYNQGKPIGHWKMDEGEGMTVYDHSGNGNHGTMTNMTSDDWVEGKVNGGLEFDGVDDYVSIADPASGELDFGTGDFSASLWFKTSNCNENFMYKRTSGGVGWFLHIDTACKPYGYINEVFTGYVNTEVNDGQWHNYIAVFDRSGNYYGYIDGKLEKTTDISSELLTSVNTTIPFYIGSYGSNYRFNGKIDDVRIYNYALTAEQIKEVYNGGAVRFR